MGNDINRKTTVQPEWSLFIVLTGFLFLFGLFTLVWLLIDLLAPIFVALLLAFVFRPLMNWTQRKWNWPAWLNVTLLLLLLAVIFSAFFVWLIPIIIEQTSQLLQKLPDYIESLMEFLSGEEVKLGEDLRSRLSELAGKPEKIIPFILSGTLQSLNVLAVAFGNVTYALVYILLLLVFFVTFCLYLPNMKQWCSQFLPHSSRDRIIDVLQKIYDASGTFLRIRLIIAMLLSLLFSIGWAVVGIPYWLLLGTATGLLNIIPYAAGLGWFAVLLVNTLEVDSSGALLFAILWPSLVFIIVQAFDGWLLTPYLQGEQLKIHPVIVLFAVLAGGVLAGLLGMLLAIPLTAAGRIIFSDLIKPRLLRWVEQH